LIVALWMSLRGMGLVARDHIPGLKPALLLVLEIPKAKALGYLEARDGCKTEAYSKG
jgi:hypothetical protein